MRKYSVGVDFGTLSARALVVDVATGEEIAAGTCEYAHGVMDKTLPGGRTLGHEWALQHPGDYLEAIGSSVKTAIKTARVSKEEIIGIGIDFTSCTILPVLSDGTPLCQSADFSDEPHAYVKLWKHHSAQYCADLLNETAERMQQDWLALYGGRISSEWMIPKVMQIVKEAPRVYEEAYRFVEAGDWLLWQLCGSEVYSECFAGYKSLYQHGNYPSKSFFKALDPALENIAEEKLPNRFVPLGSRAGALSKKAAELTGLCGGTPVAAGIIDAHASVPACKITRAGEMLMIMGTSTCHMLLSEHEMGVPGTCGIVKDGIIPGFYGYEAGQSCVGDHFSWFVENCVPAAYYEEAKKSGVNIHRYLRERAEKLRPGQSGLLALDWWNGVRSVLMDFNLSGMMLGMNLQTKPEEIYRALIEATAFGTRQIIEAFESAGVPVKKLCAAGGIPAKDPMTMQIYADVCNREIHISGSDQSGALGSAILGAVAAGSSAGGYDSVREAADVLGKLSDTVYRPIPENARVYNELFSQYKTLSDYFGRGTNNVMKELKKLREI